MAQVSTLSFFTTLITNQSLVHNLEILSDICKHCRRCCTGTDVQIYPEDISRWKQENRLDILLAINSLMGTSRQLAKKQKNEECIFLKKGLCSIHDTKPKVCRIFPKTLQHAEKYNCDAKHIFFPRE